VSQETKTYPPEMLRILQRVEAGDRTALPELKVLFEKHPDVAATFGNMAKHAEITLLKLLDSTLGKEAVTYELAALRKRLIATANSELEKLLVERVTLCWLAVNQAEMTLADLVNKHAPADVAIGAADKRLHRAHARFISSVKALATVQKLLRPAPSIYSMLLNDVPETGIRKRSRPTNSRFPGEPAGIVN
jgi:hypothetical protein